MSIYYVLPTDEHGKCILAMKIYTDNGKHTNKIQSMKRGCTSECKPLTDTKVSAIVEFEEAFYRPIQEVRHALDMCDIDCPYEHYTFVYDAVVDLQGHPQFVLTMGVSQHTKYTLDWLQHIFQCWQHCCILCTIRIHQ